jgi:hypothetical protein
MRGNIMEIMNISASIKAEVNGIITNFDIIPMKDSKIVTL